MASSRANLPRVRQVIDTIMNVWIHDGMGWMEKMEWHIKQQLSRVGEENEHMLRCRAKEEWIRYTGVVVPAPPKAYDGEPDETDPDLLWAVGGMEGQGQRGFVSGARGRRLHP